MSVFHVPPVSASTDARATRALERLCGQVDAIRSRPLAGEDFECVERELHERFVEAEREVLGELLERLDVDVPSVELGGRRYHRVLRSTETYTTAVGTVTARRTLYRCGRERAVVAMELRAGIVEGHWTPLAARQASCVVLYRTLSRQVFPNCTDRISHIAPVSSGAMSWVRHRVKPLRGSYASLRPSG